MPEHIQKWNNASADWHTPHATNDLTVGGRFTSRMESKDGAVGFDFTGVYTAIDQYEKIEYVLDDGRKVKVEFLKEADQYRIVETFDPENINPIEMQKAGWQAILDNFKAYVN